MDDIELKKMIDDYIAERFEDDSFDREIFDDHKIFRGAEIFPGDYTEVDEYLVTELKKILSECIDEYIDKIIKDDNPDEKAEHYRHFLKSMLDEYICKFTGYEFCRLTGSISSKALAILNTKRPELFWSIINLRSPIYISLFKASFRHYVFQYERQEWHLTFPTEKTLQSRNFWLEKGFRRETSFLHAANIGDRALRALCRHDYAELRAAIEEYMKEVGKSFSEMFLKLAYKTPFSTAALCERANVSRNCYYEITKKSAQQPKKRVVVSFALVLGLDVPTTEILLNAAGFFMTENVWKYISAYIEKRSKLNQQTFTEMLAKFIQVSGEKPSTIYKRAQVDGKRLLNQKNINHKPIKKIIEAFALALKLNTSAIDKLFLVADYPPVLHITGYAKKLQALLSAQADTGGKTFTEMLLEFIKDSKEKTSTIYNRAQCLPNHFSIIKNDKNYQPDKDTAIAFAVALELDLPKAENLLAAAVYILSKSIPRDLLISFFFDKKIFSFDGVSHVDLIDDWIHRCDCPPPLKKPRKSDEP